MCPLSGWAALQIVENIKEKETGNDLNFNSKEVLLSRSPEVQMVPETFHSTSLALQASIFLSTGNLFKSDASK